MNEYTILVTSLYHSHMTIPISKENVRNECERLRKILTYGEDTYKQIEVVNNETGEVREYWNNKQNETLF